MEKFINECKDGLFNMSEPIALSQCPPMKLDLSGLMKYAKNKGVQPAMLSDEEKAKFILD